MNEGALPELPGGWVWTRLENCIEVLDSQRIPINAEDREKRIAGKATSELYPYYGATGQVGWIDDYLFGEELILLGEDGAPFFEFAKNKAYIIKGKSWVNNHAHVLKAIASVTLNQFLCHYLNIFDYNGYVTGTTRAKLNQSPMRKIPIPLPPFPEQRRIVTKLEELFTKLDVGVSALKKTQAQLKRYRQSVLKAACEGKLVPTEAELAEAERRDYESADVLLARILKERRSAWEKTGKGAKHKEPLAPDIIELPKLPDGWRWVKLGEIADKINPGFPSGKHNKESQGVPHLRPMNINVKGEIDFSVVKYVQPDSYDSLLRGDVLFNNTNSPELLGKTSYIKDDTNYAYSNHMTRIRFNVSLLNPAWISYNLHNLFLSGFFKMNCTHHVNQASINSTFLSEKVPTPLPPLAEQRRIVAEVERRLYVADEVARTVEQSLAQAKRLRQSILKKAFEGRLVAQDERDEPASVLLEKIRLQKQLEIKKGRSKR